MATPAPTTKRRLGEILVDLGLVTDAQIGDALSKGKETGRMLGDVRRRRSADALATL